MNSFLPVDEQSLRDRFRFARLLRPIGGLMEKVFTLPTEPTAPDFPIGVTGLDNLTMTLPHVHSPLGMDARDEALGGAGSDFEPELAWIRAVVEGAERYACMTFEEQDMIVASARELGAAALDLERVPRCSEREYADPACPFRKPSTTEPIRWVRGYSLIDGCERLVPAVMTFLYFKPEPAERFWSMISTGVAAHTSLESALVSAICEMIERDAIALTWLARLPLPRIEFEPPLPAVLAPGHALLSRSLVKHYCFDATTDLGVPTVYAVQLVDGHPKLSQYVNCATDLDAAAACAKTIREAAPSRAVFQMQRDVPNQVSDFVSLYDGAAYLGRPQHRSEFDFLIHSTGRRALSAMKIESLTGESARLKFLLGRLKSLGMEAIAVDLTTDELRAVGLWTIRVIIPDLIPMSPVHRGRFLGHPRLYSYPEKSGFGKLTEDGINPAPQPFA